MTFPWVHFGIGAELGKLGIDIRYERGFTDNEIKIFNINQSNFNVDSRPNNILVCSINSNKKRLKSGFFYLIIFWKFIIQI